MLLQRLLCVLRCVSQEVVGKYSADFYSLNGLCIDSHKRREHLSPDDLAKNKQMVESLTRGGATSPGEGNWVDIVRHLLPQVRGVGLTLCTSR